MEEMKCLICGDKGTDKALVYCDQCVKYAAHRYCLEEITIDEYVHWICDDNYEGLSQSNSTAREQNVIQVRTIDSSNSDVRERNFGVKRKNDDVVTVNTEHNLRNLQEQSHDACMKTDSGDSVKSNEDFPGSHLVGTNKKDTMPLVVEERKSSEESLREMLEKEKSPVEIFLRDIRKMKKRKSILKSTFKEPANKNDYGTPGDTSARQSLKKNKDVEINSGIEKQNSKLRDEKRVSEKSKKSDKDLSTKKHSISLCNGSSKGSKKQKTDSSKTVISKGRIIEKHAAQPIQGNPVLELGNQCSEVSDKVIHSDPYNDDDGKIIPVERQEKFSERNPMVNYGDDLFEYLEI